MTPADKRPPIYTLRLRLRPEMDADAIRMLRWVLKKLLRQHKLKCISIDEEKES
jgi:hypothetical protein